MEHSAQQRPDAFSPVTMCVPGTASAAAAAIAAVSAGEARAKQAVQSVRLQEPQRSAFAKNASPSASEHALQTEKPQPPAQTQPCLPVAPLHVVHFGGPPKADGCEAARADIFVEKELQNSGARAVDASGRSAWGNR
jgi:hypothetical protein